MRAFDVVVPAPAARVSGVQYVQGDVNDMKAVRAACEGADVVYSTFAIIRYWESMPHQLQANAHVNVDGTNTVVEACLAEGVGQLISTSTSNVCVSKTKDLQIFDEDTPYVTADNAPHHYAYTKALAEVLVLNANGKSDGKGRALQTACVRPCSGIFGSRDRFIVQRLLDKGGYDVVVLGTIDWIYVDNVVWGHLLAERALTEKPNQVLLSSLL